MLMKLCIAAAVALGCILMVPGPSFAAGEQDKSVTTDKAKPAKPKATAQHKKPKKGFADDAHDLPVYTGGQRGEITSPQRGQLQRHPQEQPQGQAR
jgi:hypothetical protein